MLWTVVAAAFLAFLKSVQSSDGGAMFLQGGSIPYLLIESLGITALLLGLYWRFRRLPFFHEPGHAAFVAHSLNALFVVLWAMLWNSLNGSNDDAWTTYVTGNSWLNWLLLYGWYLLLALQVLVYVLFAYRFRARRRWKLFFILQVVVSVLQIAGQMVIAALMNQNWSTTSDTQTWLLLQSAFPLALQTLLVIGLALVVWKDHCQSVSYHWTHWLGVGIWAAMWLAMLIGLIASMLFPPEWLAEEVIESQLLLE